MTSNALVFVHEILRHWLAIVTGSGVSLFMLVKEKWSGKPIRRKAISAIFLAGLLISIFLAWQDEHTSAEWRGGEIQRLTGLTQQQDNQIEGLSSLLAQKDRPIVLQQDPEIKALLKGQQAEIGALRKEVPSPRKTALQLSNDILLFTEAARKNDPAEASFASRPDWDTGKSQQENERIATQFYQQLTRAEIAWMQQTASAYDLKFGTRVADLAQQAKDAGISDASSVEDMCVGATGNTYVMEKCGARIGALAHRLPH